MVISEEKKGLMKRIVIGIVAVIILSLAGYGTYSLISTNKERLSKVKKEILKSELKANIVYDNEKVLYQEFTKNDVKQAVEMAKDFITMFNEREFSGIRKMMPEGQVYGLDPPEEIIEKLRKEREAIRVRKNPQILIEPVGWGNADIPAIAAKIQDLEQREESQWKVEYLELCFIKNIDGEIKFGDIFIFDKYKGE